MPDIPPAVIQAAAAAIERELMSDHEYAMAADSEEALARVALEAAAAALGEHAASKILAHMEAHSGQDPRRRHAYRMHMQTAARIAARAFLTEDDLDRLAVEAIVRGDFIACEIPEVPGA